MKRIKIKQKNKKYYVIGGLLLSIFIVFLFVQFNPFGIPVLVDDDEKPELIEPIGVPVLNEIEKLTLTYTLEWEFSTPYTIEYYLIWKSVNSSSWLWYDSVDTKSYQIVIFSAGLYDFKIQVKISHEGYYYNSEHSNVKSFIILAEDVSPVLQPIVPNPNTDGNINLNWYDVINAQGYRVYRFTDNVWSEIADLNKEITEYIDIIDENGTYIYFVESYFVINRNPSNTESIVVVLETTEEEQEELTEPLNPSITINNEAENTMERTVMLQLSCENAIKMKFDVANTGWSEYETYSASKDIDLVLPEQNEVYPTYRIAVTFISEDGIESEIIWADIEYIGEEWEEGEEEEETPPIEQDYTYLYYIIPVIISLLAIITVYLYLKKSKKIK